MTLDTLLEILAERPISTNPRDLLACGCEECLALVPALSDPVLAAAIEDFSAAQVF